MAWWFSNRVLFLEPYPWVPVRLCFSANIAGLKTVPSFSISTLQIYVHVYYILPGSAHISRDAGMQAAVFFCARSTIIQEKETNAETERSSICSIPSSLPCPWNNWVPEREKQIQRWILMSTIHHSGILKVRELCLRQSVLTCWSQWAGCNSNHQVENSCVTVCWHTLPLYQGGDSRQRFFSALYIYIYIYVSCDWRYNVGLSKEAHKSIHLKASLLTENKNIFLTIKM